MGLRTPILGMMLGLSCCLCRALPADEYSQRIWRSDDGLPQNKIQVVTQTRDGYLWIGTSGGLVRFDGVRFVVFDRSNTPALQEDSILSLCPAKDGSLWIGTEGGGLVHLSAGRFTALGSREGLTNGFVRSLVEDREGRLWVSTDRGFFRYSAPGFFRVSAPAGTAVGGSRVVCQDRAGRLWVGTNVGLFTVAGDRLEQSRPEYKSLGEIFAILETADGTLRVATDSGVRRLLHGEVQPASHPDVAGARSLLEDGEGNLWVGTEASGLARISGAGATRYRASGMLPDNTVWSVFEDREHNLWVGTQDGLLRLTRSAVHTISSANGLADDNVATVYEDPGGTIWIATIRGQLYRLQGDRLQGDRAVLFALPEGGGGFHARNIYVDREGAQWIGSNNQGLIRISGGKARLFTIADGMRSNSIRQVLEDRAGVIWIATGSGLSRWDGRSMKTFYLEDGLAYGSTIVLAEDRNGDLLVGTDGGLNRVRDGRFLPDPVFARLGNERIRSILCDTNGSLWLGTRGNGLIRIREGRIRDGRIQDEITRYTTRDGLLSNSVYQVLEDRNRFWLSSSAGVFSVDRGELEAVADGREGPIGVVPYGTDSGMPSSQMNGGVQCAGFQSRSGAFWFPSVKGAVRVDPEQLRPTPLAPVLIESAIADDRSLSLAGTVEIPAGRGKLEIGFTSPNLLSPDRVTFRYRLEGFDDAWTPSPRRRAAYYTNLPPGKYRFRVIARDGAQPGLTSEAVLPFVWKARFYQTARFDVACVLLAALVIFASFRLYARQTRDRYGLVLAERTRLAREMHDTVIQGCVGVSTLLEAARSMPPAAADKAGPLIDRAASQIRLTVMEAREAVWDLRHSGTEHGLADTLQDFARQIAAAEGVLVSAEIEGTPVALSGAAERNLLLVAREAIRNAVMHARPGHVDVALRFGAGDVCLEVRDDGKGFVPDTAREDVHYGITGMRERVEQSGGKFELRSSPGYGTTVTVRLPVKG